MKFFILYPNLLYTAAVHQSNSQVQKHVVSGASKQFIELHECTPFKNRIVLTVQIKM